MTYEKDQINIALQKALTFFVWAEKVAMDPTRTVDMFWEKVFMEGDTLLYLQKASSSNGAKELTDLTTGTISRGVFHFLRIYSQFGGHIMGWAQFIPVYVICTPLGRSDCSFEANFDDST